MTTSSLVLVATDGMETAVRDLVAEACVQSGATPHFADGNSTLALAVPPSLVVAGLPEGQRFVPELAAKLVTQAGAQLPLLLVCEESLVRYSVSLARGRLTLVGRPLTREKVAGRIRLLLAGRLEIDERQDDEDAPRVREYRGREWWAGVGVAGPLPVGHGEVLPFVSKVGREGFAGLVPLDLAGPPTREQLQHTIEQITAGGAAPTLDGTLAAVRYEAEHRRWSFQWPSEWPVKCVLTSPARFPSRWPLQPVEKGGWRHVPASSGDIVLLCASGARAETEAAMAAAMSEGAAENGGGPALLDRLEKSLRERDHASAFVVAELR